MLAFNGHSFARPQPSDKDRAGAFRPLLECAAHGFITCRTLQGSGGSVPVWEAVLAGMRQKLHPHRLAILPKQERCSGCALVMTGLSTVRGRLRRAENSGYITSRELYRWIDVEGGWG